MILNVSVIIPVYNSSKFINFCLKSVINQTYPIHEVILINDNSKDKSLDVILNFIKNYNGNIIFKVFSNQITSGPSYSRNVGLKNLSDITKYIAFLDSDDFWNVDKIKLQVNILESNKLSLFNYCFFANFNDKTQTFSNGFNRDANFCYKNILFGNYVSGSCSSVILDIKLFKIVGFFDESLRCAEDWDYWLRCFNFTKPSSLNKIMTNIRDHRNNSQKRYFFMYKELIKFWNLHLRRNKYNLFLKLYFIKVITSSKYYPIKLENSFDKVFLIGFLFSNSKSLFHFNKFINSFIKIIFRIFRKLLRITENE